MNSPDGMFELEISARDSEVVTVKIPIDTLADLGAIALVDGGISVITIANLEGAGELGGRANRNSVRISAFEY